MLKLISTLVIFVCCFTALNADILPDSIGVVKLNGETYVLYEVDRGETLYSISKKYDINTDAILSANTYIKDFSISEGQIIKIPMSAIRKTAQENNAVSLETNTVTVSTSNDSEEEGDVPVNENLIKHTVEKGETLYSLSKKYGIRVTEIVEWNDLKNYSIKEGQTLVVGKKEAETVKEADNTTPEEELIADIDEDATISRPAFSGDQLSSENVLSLQYKEQLSTQARQEKHRTGIATWISSSSPFPVDDGYYALHRDLPIGTIVKVKNLMNNRVIYAKVIGNLPNNAENEKLLIKLPQEAAKELNVLDARMMVQVSYLESK